MYRKAIYGALIAALTAGLGASVIALDDGSVTVQDWLKIALAAVVALGSVGGTVWGVTNKPAG